MRYSDTSPEAHAMQIAAYRRMKPSRRVELALGMSEDARAVAMAGIGARHPEYSVDDVRFTLRRLLLGDDLARRAWPNGSGFER